MYFRFPRMSFTLKSCKIVAGISTVRQFHEFLKSNFWQVFDIRPYCVVQQQSTATTHTALWSSSSASLKKLRLGAVLTSTQFRTHREKYNQTWPDGHVCPTCQQQSTATTVARFHKFCPKMIRTFLFQETDLLSHIIVKIPCRLQMTKSNMLGKIVCCYLKQFIGFLKQKDPINFWTISEKVATGIQASKAVVGLSRSEALSLAASAYS